MLTDRALNRATLDRQLLLRRVARPFAEVVEHLVGLQAQNPRDPYLGLLARLDGFDPAELSAAIAERRAVRTPFLRATIHLVTAADALATRPVVDPVLVRTFGSTSFARAIAAVDRTELLATGRALLEEAPRTRADLGRILAERHPGPDGSSLAMAVTYLLPVVQVPPRGLWEATGTARWAPVEQWLGRPHGPADPPDALVLRYLAAFGPASTKDVRVWSGLAGVAEVIERLRPRLRTFRDARGVELFDLPDAPRPDPDTPAPPRFLPEYDNVLLSHADRSRVFRAGRVPPGWAGNVLLDGFYIGSWKPAITRSSARLVVTVQAAVEPGERTALQDEGNGLLARLAPGVADRDVEIHGASPP